MIHIVCRHLKYWVWMNRTIKIENTNGNDESHRQEDSGAAVFVFNFK